ncbi:MAG: NAD(P)H-hydrate dehydratase [Cyanobacteria bacterium]|nr:NAD(P)H-hydrate dehydratase [Cyanobacteriota bacterium]MDA0864905.1 NAD(P)H-hydrate dehydratase [Cyanobacteriota bacterium]
MNHIIVTARQMRAIEGHMFAGGIPVAALMEKVAGRIADWIVQQYPCLQFPHIGFLVGPGHNGGDALVVARELHHQGYQVQVLYLTERRKDLTAAHGAYLNYLGVPTVSALEDLQACDLIVDGGFGFGLERPLIGEIAQTLATLNGWERPVISIDLPSGLHTDTGASLGTAIQATHTLCLGLWKRGLFQDLARAYRGEAHRIPFDIPESAIAAVLGPTPPLQQLTDETALAHLPLPRSATAHKYTAGHLLLIAGSHRYGGAALLAGKGAIASGVGMLTLVVPESLKAMVLGQLPEALVIGAEETEDGVIAALPEDWQETNYDAIACGPGMTPAIGPVMTAILKHTAPLLLDADALNWVAIQPALAGLANRAAPTLLTPHLGEFRRLFPTALDRTLDPIAAAQLAIQGTQTGLILKGANSTVTAPKGRQWIMADSTPALARGGSGDVLTGLIGGLMAQQMKRPGQTPEQAMLSAAISGVWWHGMTGRAIAHTHTELGCSPSQLAAALPSALAPWISGEAISKP